MSDARAKYFDTTSQLESLIETDGVRLDRRTLLPLISVVFMYAVHVTLPVAQAYRPKVLPHFTYFSLFLIIIALAAVGLSVFYPDFRKKYAYKGHFYGAAFLLLNFYNLITLKLNVLPSLYFPAPERVLAVFVKDWAFMLQCLVFSLRLLLSGFLLGALSGVFTGTVIGWSPRVNYWIQPVIRVVGPIPSTAWIPLALIVFPKATWAAVWLIALGVWFPTTILTSSGIMNVRKSYFEVSSTLGASDLRNVLKIALPGALPSIFAGLFNGTSSSFLTLMAAEMIGCKYGIGWYINWQRETLAYANIYSALIIIAVTFSLLINLQFKLRNRVLAWQKGTIRW
jgi:NitT/TauT family transport system permease protein